MQAFVDFFFKEKVIFFSSVTVTVVTVVFGTIQNPKNSFIFIYIYKYKISFDFFAYWILNCNNCNCNASVQDKLK